MTNEERLHQSGLAQRLAERAAESLAIPGAPNLVSAIEDLVQAVGMLGRVVTDTLGGEGVPLPEIQD